MNTQNHIKDYLQLEQKLIGRRLRAFGIKPIFGILGIIGTYLCMSEYLFYKTRWSSYIILAFGIYLMLLTSDKKRIEFLKHTYNEAIARSIRIIENALLCLPLICTLLYHEEYIMSIVLLFMIPISVLFSWTYTNFKTIRSPFYKYPFEFTAGFRTTYYFFLIAYILTAIAIIVENFNLGLFSIILVSGVCMSYYSKTEPIFYVWIFNCSPRRFLLNKLKIAARYYFVLQSPIAISLAFFHFEGLPLNLLFLALGMILLWLIILVKYSVYPKEMQIPESIFICLCIIFPPLALVFLIYFYRKSCYKLNFILA